MKRTIIHWVNLVAILVTVSACTSFQELEVPDSFSVDENSLSFAAGQSSLSLTVKSGPEWRISQMPEWIKVQTIKNARAFRFEWEIVFAVTDNEEYDREGEIVIQSQTGQIVIPVHQEGQKGKYVAIESITLSSTKIILTEGEVVSLTCQISPSNATEKTVFWTSTSPSVAIVDADGTVLALTRGTTFVTARTKDGDKEATCFVTVIKSDIVSGNEDTGEEDLF